MADVMDAYWRAPPIARTLATATLVSSIAVHLGFVRYGYFYFAPSLLLRLPPQVWRLGTAYLITGPQLSILFDTYFLYTYLSDMEIGNPRFPRKEDVVWYLILVTSAITTMCSYLFGGGVFLPALILALVRTATQDQRGMKANFYFVTIPAQLMPFCMMLVSLLFPGGAYTFMMQLTGLIAAHLYDFLTRLWPEFTGQPNYLATPAFLSRLIRTPRVLRRDYGTAIRPNAAPSTGSSTGASLGSGPLPDSWKSRGTGRKLGE